MQRTPQRTSQILTIICLFSLTTFFTSCEDTSKGDPNLNLQLPPNFNVDLTSSHTLQTTSLYVDWNAIRGIDKDGFILAISYADFDQDGDIDIFMAPGGHAPDVTPAEFYLNDGSGNFVLDNSLFNGSPPEEIHPRKALTGDFNGDGKMDVFVLGHGFDLPPFPGEAPYVLLSSDNGFVLGSGLSKLVGYNHGGASADIDADGDIDVFIANNDKPYFLINDGKGKFHKDRSRTIGLDNKRYFTAELVDVDEDGYVDLLIAGHEQSNAESKIFWGDSTGLYSTSKSSTLPAVPLNGTVVDIDVADIDLDGDKDIVLSRTGDGTDTLEFYQGYYVQVLENIGNRTFVDKTSEKLPTGSNAYSGYWIEWIRLKDMNGDGYVDIVDDDAAKNLIWYNDKNGSFN